MPGDPRRERLREELLRLAAQASRSRRAARGGTMTTVLVLSLVALGTLQLTADVWMGPHASDLLLLAGANVPARVLRGEWWRLWTAPLLHADSSHLLINAAGLYLLGRPLELAYGPLRLWLIVAAAAFAASLATLTGHAPLSIGASGAVFGMLGALVALGMKIWLHLGLRQRIALVVGPALLLAAMLWIGVAAASDSRRIDQVAHAGGTLGGLAAALLLRPRIHRKSVAGLAAFGRDAILRGVAWGLAAVSVAACLMATLRIGKRIELPVLERKSFDYQGLTVPYPADVRRGLWRDGNCRGTMVDGAWALRTGRRLCFELPLGATLFIGRRDELLTVDAADIEALHAANRSGAMVRRQDNVEVYPLGHRLMYVLLAPEAVLASEAASLAPVLPAAGSATVHDRPRPGLLEWPGLPDADTPSDAP